MDGDRWKLEFIHKIGNFFLSALCRVNHKSPGLEVPAKSADPEMCPVIGEIKHGFCPDVEDKVFLGRWH